MANRILAAYPQEVETVVRSGNGMTGAQFQDLCSNTALAFYFKEQEPAAVGDDCNDATCYDCLAVQGVRE